MFRENREGRVYGLTFVDNKSGVVFNGSDLGKSYSGQALIKQFSNWPSAEQLSNNTFDHAKKFYRRGIDQNHGTATRNGLDQLYNLLKAEKSSDSVDPHLKRRPKRKKGLSL